MEGPKRPPRGIQEAPKTRGPQEAPKRPPGCPKRLPRGSQEAPQRPPNGPKKPPRGLEEVPKKPPRGPKEAPQRPHNDWSAMLFPPLGELRRCASQVEVGHGGAHD